MSDAFNLVSKSTLHVPAGAEVKVRAFDDGSMEISYEVRERVTDPVKVKAMRLRVARARAGRR